MKYLTDWRPWLLDTGAWILCWAATTAAVVIGALFGLHLVASANHPVGLLDALARIDGQNYRHIAETGYQYEPGEPSYVAFFPAFPLAARWLSMLSGLATVSSELIVANTCCFIAFGVMRAYLRLRGTGKVGTSRGAPAARGADLPARSGESPDYALLSMALVPTTFFFRVAYTESMFTCLAIITLYAIARRWPATIVASVVGLATAVRPVGICLLLPLAAYAWRRREPKFRAACRVAGTILLGCWGLGAYMLFLGERFGQPLAFAITQKYHRMRPIGTFGDEVFSLLAWEPIRDVYDRASPGYWQALHYVPSRLFSLEFANPIYLLGTAALIIFGAWKRWLTRDELLVAVPLLVIPYLTRAYEMRMLSQARFAVVVFPAYIVIGELLARSSRLIAVSLLALSALMMGTYAALFAAGYPFL
jgi:hypothetical protein